MPTFRDIPCEVCGVSFSRPSKLRPRFCSLRCRDSLHPRVTTNCGVCGKGFSRPACEEGRAKYCSKKCKGIAKRRLPIKCVTCGKDFSASTTRNQRFCSNKCFAATRLLIETRPCAECSKPVTRKKNHFPRNGYRVYCSPECLAEARSGARCHLWRGGIGDDRGPNWHRQRNRARARDGYCCQRCGVSEDEYGQQLDVHHVIPFRLFSDYRVANEMTNLLSVCSPCHVILEGDVKDLRQMFLIP